MCRCRRGVTLNAGTYIDPAAGKVTFETYAGQWRANLTTDPHTRMQVESRLRVHVYPVLGPAPMGVLAKRPSLIQQWIKGLEAKLAPSTIRGVVSIVSTIFSAAIDDQVVVRNPVAAGSVRTPRSQRRKVVPWDLATVEAIAAGLGGRHAAMVYLGAGLRAPAGRAIRRRRRRHRLSWSHGACPAAGPLHRRRARLQLAEGP